MLQDKPNQDKANRDAEHLLVLFRRELIRELMGVKCRCGEPKQRGFTFCRICYLSLPQGFRNELQKKLGEGYEQAYETACRMLERATGTAAGGA
jgi:hypothetical protein